MVKKTYLFIAAIAAVLIFSLICVAAEEALLKVVETPVRPIYTELPGFGAAAFLLSTIVLVIYYAFAKKINKKGVSPLIATVLLVAMTIAMFLAVFAFSKSFIKEQVEKGNGQPIEQSCLVISYNAVLSGNRALITNTGNVVLYGFNIKAEKDGRTTMTFLRTENGKVGSGETDTLELGGLASYNTVTLIPVLLGKGTQSGSGKLFPCTDASRVLT